MRGRHSVRSGRGRHPGGRRRSYVLWGVLCLLNIVFLFVVLLVLRTRGDDIASADARRAALRQQVPIPDLAIAEKEKQHRTWVDKWERVPPWYEMMKIEPLVCTNPSIYFPIPEEEYAAQHGFGYPWIFDAFVERHGDNAWIVAHAAPECLLGQKYEGRHEEDSPLNWWGSPFLCQFRVAGRTDELFVTTSILVRRDKSRRIDALIVFSCPIPSELKPLIAASSATSVITLSVLSAHQDTVGIATAVEVYPSPHIPLCIVAPLKRLPDLVLPGDTYVAETAAAHAQQLTELRQAQQKAGVAAAARGRRRQEKEEEVEEEEDIYLAACVMLTAENYADKYSEGGRGSKNWTAAKVRCCVVLYCTVRYCTDMKSHDMTCIN